MLPHVPQHTMLLYQKPALGTDFITRYNIYNYRHAINAIGGFDTASCDLVVRSRDEGQLFLDQYLGNRIAFYVNNPLEPIWEGYINRMTFSAGGVDYSISLDEMANRVVTTYTSLDSTVTSLSASAETTSSQALYGIKQENIDLGYMAGSAGVNTIRDTVLAQRAFPKSSILPGSSGNGLLHLECLGFYHTLTWEHYRNTVSGNVQQGAFVDTILGGLVNGATFFDNTDLTETDANTNLVNQLTIKGETAWDILLKLIEFGNTTDYFVGGVTPTLFATGTRRFYYRAASTTVTYTARQADGLRVRNLYGQIVDPWRVQPDTGIRVSDVLIGWNGVGDNPTETYIKKIDYDANRQSVIYSGDDDLTAEGVFNRNRWNRAQRPGVGRNRRLA